MNSGSATVVAQLTGRMDEVKQIRAHHEIALNQMIEQLYEFTKRMLYILRGKGRRCASRVWGGVHSQAGEKEDTPAVYGVEYTSTAYEEA